MVAQIKTNQVAVPYGLIALVLGILIPLQLFVTVAVVQVIATISSDECNDNTIIASVPVHMQSDDGNRTFV